MKSDILKNDSDESLKKWLENGTLYGFEWQNLFTISIVV